MSERPLALVAERLARDRDACETQRITTMKQLEAAKARNKELQLELRACEADKLAAQKAVCDAHTRARATKEALVLVDQQSVIAAAVLMHKEEQLLQYSECFRVLHQQTRELEEQQKTALEDVVREASDLRSEVARLRRDLGQQEVLRTQLEQARQETSSLQGVVENARTHASAALSERDNLRRSLDELRRRFVDVESEASALRSKASTATAGSKAVIAQLEDLRHELKEAEHSKNICFTELHVLRRQVDVAKSEAIDTKKQMDALRQELHAIQREGNENSVKEKDGSPGRDKLAIATRMECVEGQRKCLDLFSTSRCEMVATVSSVAKTFNEMWSASAQSKSRDNAVQVCDHLGVMLPNTHCFPKVGATSSPSKGDELRNIKSNSRDLRMQQGMVQLQHLQKQNPSCYPALGPLCNRGKSRLWRPGCNKSGVVKKQKRGRIEKSDLEKVGYTRGCRGCRVALNGEHPQSHTEACRARVFAELVRLNLPAARRLRNAEERMEGRHPKKTRIASYPDNVESRYEIRSKQAELSTRCIISVVRASATK